MRLIDITASIIGLVLLSPLFLLLAILVRVSSPGPVFFRGRRAGRDGKVFGLYKFRSMVAGADKSGPGITASGDSRITPIGRLLRRTKLDELPQLINVLKGDMSLVGPRPEDPRYVALYTPEQRQVLNIRPGITSAATLYYCDEENLLAGPNWEEAYVHRIMPHKLAMELEYMKRRTIWKDLAIVVKTIIPQLRGNNSRSFAPINQS